MHPVSLQPDPQISPELLAEAERILEAFEDSEEFSSRCLKVLDKRGQMVPLIFNTAQKRLKATIQKIREAGRPVRIIILKTRRAGFSTGVAGEIFKETAFEDGQRSLVVAHEGKAVKESLFPMYRRFHDHYSPLFGKIVLPPLVRDTLEGLEYANQSAITIQSAKNLEGARSFGFRRVHLSEFAFYPHPKTLMTALMQTVPDDPDTMVIVESTANGVGGAFYDLWQLATSPNQDSEWVALFFGCYDDPANWRTLEISPDEFQRSMSKEEFELQRRFNLQLEQLNWRRWCIVNKCDNSVDSFNQEYPATPQMAFLLSGRPRFDHRDIDAQEAIPGTKGELDQEEIGRRVELVFNARKGGALTLWKKPSRLKQYIIGSDPARGVDINEGTGTADPDYSVAHIFERELREQVATLRERIQPGPFGEYLYDLGKWYNWGFIVVESNGPGLATLEALIRLGYPQDRLYKRRQIDRSGLPRKELFGWNTSEVTRPLLISHYDNALRNREIIIKDAITLQESRTFVIKPNGRAEHADGCHDDTVFAAALAVVGIIEAPDMTPVDPMRRNQALSYAPTNREKLIRDYYGAATDDDGWDD